MTLSKRLKTARAAVGLNQTELAKQLGVTPQSVQLWESESASATSPRAKRIKELASLLKVREEWLALGKGPMQALAANEGRDVPLLTMAQVPFWLIGRFQADYQSHVYCPVACSSKTFAILAPDQDARMFLLKGDTIFIDAEATSSARGICLKLSKEQEPALLPSPDIGSSPVDGYAVYMTRDLSCMPE